MTFLFEAFEPTEPVHRYPYIVESALDETLALNRHHRRSPGRYFVIGSHTMSTLRIGCLAERTGTNAPTIRYYEEIGLLRVADRKSGGQRVYDEEDVKRLTVIRRCREFGFSIEQVKSLVAQLDDRERSCLEVRDLAREHLATVRGKLKELRARERSIARLVENCNSLCLGGPGPDCVVLDNLSRRAAPTDELKF